MIHIGLVLFYASLATVLPASLLEDSSCFSLGRGNVSGSGCSHRESHTPVAFARPQNSSSEGHITCACSIPDFGAALCDEERSVLVVWTGESTVDVQLSPLSNPVGAIYFDGKLYVACFGGTGDAGLAVVDPFGGKLLKTYSYLANNNSYVHNVYTFSWNGQSEIFLAVLGNPWAFPPVPGDGLVWFNRQSEKFVLVTSGTINARSAVQQSEHVFYILTQEPKDAPTRIIRLLREGHQLLVQAVTELPARSRSGRWGGDGGADVLLGRSGDTLFCTDRAAGLGKLYYYSYSNGSFSLMNQWDTGNHPRHASMMSNGDIVVSNRDDSTITVFRDVANTPLATRVETAVVNAADEASLFFCTPTLNDCQAKLDYHSFFLSSQGYARSPHLIKNAACKVFVVFYVGILLWT